MPESAKRLLDGIADFAGGIDSGKTPTIAYALNQNGLRRNQVSFAVNCTMRGGNSKPRPGNSKIQIGELPDTYPSMGRFMGAGSFRPETGEECLVACIGGRYFRYNVGTNNSVSDITPTEATPNNRPHVWFYQAETFLIAQDGQSKPMIYDGGSSVRAGDKQIPGGTVGTYCMGRIWQVLADEQSFMAGDLVYSVTGQTKDVLGSTENTFLNDGGTFSVPNNAGKIRAIKPISNLDTTLGQGSLLVFCEHGVFAVNAPINRDEWKNLQYPIQTVALLANGGESQSSTVIQNGDMFYRSQNEIRSFYMARREFGDWGNTGMSREMNRILLRDTRYLLEYASAEVFDNRLLMTCSPVNTPQGVYHRGIAVLDFDLVSSMANKLPPAWEGVWNGLKILQLVKCRIKNQDRLFAFVLSDEREVELWEITKDRKSDWNGTVDVPINWWFETASYPFDLPFSKKRLEGGDTWIENLSGDVSFTLQFRADRYPCWRNWMTWSDCAGDGNCEIEDCALPKDVLPQYRPRKTFTTPPEDCDPILKTEYRDGYEFQARLSITGYCEIKQLRLMALTRVEPWTGECD